MTAYLFFAPLTILLAGVLANAFAFFALGTIGLPSSPARKRSNTSFPLDARGRTGLSPSARRDPPRSPRQPDDGVTARSRPHVAVGGNVPSKRTTARRGNNGIAGPLALPAATRLDAFRC
jgi:hypothetical protein